MVYTCAYFHSPDKALDTAQERKVDYVCRKLRLHPATACWTSAAAGAAGHPRRQALRGTGRRDHPEPAAGELANERIRRAGLADRCRVELRDYRHVNEPEGFDKVSAIGILEHVGEAKLPAYFQQAWKMLKPGGVS